MSKTQPSGQPLGALDGVRVLELTSGVAGSIAGMLLADLGADVVKCQSPDGTPSAADPGRHVWDRNKRAAVLDCSTKDDIEALRQLLERADIVLVGTNGSGATYDWLRQQGMSPTDRSCHWVVMPPYLLGHTPWAGERESAGLLFAWLGHAWNQASYDDVPVDCLYPIALQMQGIWAATVAVAMVVGSRAGRRVGRLAVVGGAHGAMLISPGGFAASRGHQRIHRPGGPGGTLPNYRCYRCSDGTWLFLGCFTNAFIRRGFGAIGADHILADLRIDGDPGKVRLPDNLSWVTQELVSIFSSRPREEWLGILGMADVPAAPAAGTDGWLDHEQVRAMGLRREIHNDADQHIVMPGMFVELSETPGILRSAAPTKHPTLQELNVDWPSPEGKQRDRDTDAMELPLRGMRVVDLGTIIAGPFLGTLLGELGADVIKCERPPNGDEFRVAHGGRGGVGFSVYNRDQRSVMIDLASEDGRDAFLRLVRSTDVVIENYRPNVMDRLGIAHERLAEANPLVTTVSINAFGGVGPLGLRPGFDPVVQAMSGIMRSQGGPDESNSPVFLTAPVNDVISAGLGAFGTCAALFARGRIGRGQRVSVTLCAASCLVQSEHLVRFDGRPVPPVGGRDFAGGLPTNRLYRTVDGWVRLDGRWPEDWPSLLEMGLLATETDDVGDLGSLDEAVGAIAEALKELPVAEVVRRCASVGVPAVEARQSHQLVDDELLIGRGLLHATEHGDVGANRVEPGRWIEFPGLVLSPPGAAPQPGEHGESVLLGAGLSQSEARSAGGAKPGS